VFTGIIENVGKVAAVHRSGVDARLRIEAQWPNEAAPGVKLGDSVAINGTCLTVVSFESTGETVVMAFDASHETLRLTSLGDLAAGSACNLERAVRPSDRLGGHLVTGHVDCTAERISVVKTGDCWDVTYGLPAAIAAEVAQKGSIAIDGVSLTVNTVANDRFSVTLIPHTVSGTQLLQGAGPRRVNLESDLLAKYVRRLLSVGASGQVTLQSLADAGFSTK
jgi:riboflavin synthase